MKLFACVLTALTLSTSAFAGTSPAFLSAARGVVGCYETLGGRLIHQSYDESGQCGMTWTQDESIWVRQSRNSSIRTDVTFQETTGEPYERVVTIRGLVEFRDDAGRLCRLVMQLEQGEEDASLEILRAVECR